MQIDKALVEGHPYRGIAKQFGVSEHALWRHKADDLLETIVRAHDAKLIAEATDVLGALVVYKKRLDKMLEACDEWLKDPDDPDRYYVGPNAGDVSVTYFAKNGDGNFKKHKQRLSEILEAVQVQIGDDAYYASVDIVHSDPRNLVIATQGEVRKTLELIAELQGKLQRQPQFNVLLAPEFVIVRDAVLNALRPHAQAREAVTKALKEVGE